MDSKNPRRDEQSSQMMTSESIPSAAAISKEQFAQFQTNQAFAYQSAQFNASATTTSGAQHTRAVVFPITDASPSPAELDMLANHPPVIVPVLGAQPVTQPLPRERDHTLDDLAYPWPDEQDEAENDEAPDIEADSGPDKEPELDIPDYFSDQVALRDDAFALRERSWDGWRRLRKTALFMLSLALMLAVAVFGGAVAASYLIRASDHLTIAQAQPTVSSYSNGIVVQPGSEIADPTPEAPKYQIGAWLSNNAPSGGKVKVFVRLSEDTAAIAQIPVTLEVQMPGGDMVKLGPTKTDAYGLVAFTVHFGGVQGTPVFVTATATVGAQELTAQTVFVPI